MPVGHYERYPGLNDGLGYGERRCSKCRVVKPRRDFSPDTRLRADGVQSICKDCRRDRERAWRAANVEELARRSKAYFEAHREQATASRLAWKRRNRARVRAYGLKARYGLSAETHAAMLLAQGHRCAICDKTFTKRHHTDHDHATGVVRGILCGGCNIALGFIEKPGFLDAALAYLRHHGATHTGPRRSGAKATLSSA